MIVGRSKDYMSDDSTLNPPLVEMQANPMRRDTVYIASGASATLRFIADNPGVWFMHCKPIPLVFYYGQSNCFSLGHIEWHLETGLAIELIESPLLIQQRANVPQIMYDQCRTDGTPFSGDAAGHASITDLSGLPLGPFPQVLGWHPKGIGAMAGCVVLPAPLLALSELKFFVGQLCADCRHWNGLCYMVFAWSIHLARGYGA
jgi:iron transport multicopper oxidase